MTDETYTRSRRRLAALLGVSKTAVGEWHAAGLLPWVEPGGFDVSRCREWLAARRQGQGKRRVETGAAALARLRRAQADLVRLHVDRARGALVPAGWATDQLEARARLLAHDLAALAKRVAPGLEGVDARAIAGRLEEETRELLERFATAEPESPVPRPATEDDPFTDEATIRPGEPPSQAARRWLARRRLLDAESVELELARLHGLWVPLTWLDDLLASRALVARRQLQGVCRGVPPLLVLLRTEAIAEHLREEFAAIVKHYREALPPAPDPSEAPPPSRDFELDDDEENDA